MRYFDFIGLYTFFFGVIGTPVFWFVAAIASGDWSFPPLWFISGTLGGGFILGNLSYLFNERWR